MFEGHLARGSRAQSTGRHTCDHVLVDGLAFGLSETLPVDSGVTLFLARQVHQGSHDVRSVLECGVVLSVEFATAGQLFIFLGRRVLFLWDFLRLHVLDLAFLHRFWRLLNDLNHWWLLCFLALDCDVAGAVLFCQVSVVIEKSISVVQIWHVLLCDALEGGPWQLLVGVFVGHVAGLLLWSLGETAPCFVRDLLPSVLG